MIRLRHEEQHVQEWKEQKKLTRERPRFGRNGVKRATERLGRKVGRGWLNNLGGLERKTVAGVFEGRLFY